MIIAFESPELSYFHDSYEKLYNRDLTPSDPFVMCLALVSSDTTMNSVEKKEETILKWNLSWKTQKIQKEGMIGI
ncbi:MAG TPA: hypothetical protein VGU44_05850 [Gammaproteobacteria bacterium]|nr:hypothetical protein [Gammaproteobacteria bacterium]